MKLPLDEILVFGPVAVVAVIYGCRQAYLAMKYRQVP